MGNISQDNKSRKKQELFATWMYKKKKINLPTYNFDFKHGFRLFHVTTLFTTNIFSPPPIGRSPSALSFCWPRADGASLTTTNFSPPPSLLTNNYPVHPSYMIVRLLQTLASTDSWTNNPTNETPIRHQQHRPQGNLRQPAILATTTTTILDQPSSEVFANYFNNNTNTPAPWKSARNDSHI